MTGNNRRKVLTIATTILVIGTLIVSTHLRVDWFFGTAEAEHIGPEVEQIQAISALGRIEPASRIRRIVPYGESRSNAVAKLNVSEGDFVVTDQVLATLDNHEHLAADVPVAMSKVDIAKARLNLILSGTHPRTIEAKRVEIQTHDSQLKKLAVDLERARRLKERNVITRSEIEEIEWQFNNSGLVKDRLSEELAALEDVRDVDVKLAKAELSNAEAELKKSIVRCDLAQVRSPINGQVLRIHAREGEAVGDLGLLELADIQEMQVVAEVFEADAHRVVFGMNAMIRVVSSGLEFQGKVVESGNLVGRQVVLSGDPVSDVDARVIEVRIDVDPSALKLVSKLSNARVEVLLEPVPTQGREHRVVPVGTSK